MTPARLNRLVLAVAATSILLTGCAATAPAPAETAPTSPEQTIAPAPEMTPTPDETVAVPEDLDCASLLAQASLAQLEDAGWTSKQTPFLIADTELTGGIQCMWAESANASGNVLLFAWAPIDDDLAKSLEDKLVAAGLTREAGADGVYVSEVADATVEPGADGSGFTYLFGDGWVTAAETRESLALIVRP